MRTAPLFACVVSLSSVACGGRIDAGADVFGGSEAPRTVDRPPTSSRSADGVEEPQDAPLPPPVTRTSRGHVRLSSPAVGEPGWPGRARADAYFHEAYTATIAWGCTERDAGEHAPSSGGSQDAGTVTLAFAPERELPPLDLLRPSVGKRYLPERDSWADRWTPRNEGVGAPLTVRASGGVDVPAFSVVASSAETTAFRGLPDQDAVLPAGDLVLSWPETRNDEVVAILYSGARIVWCRMPASVGSLRIPATMVESVRQHAGDYESFRGLVVTVERRTRVDVEGVAVDVVSEERRDRSLRATK